MREEDHASLQISRRLNFLLIERAAALFNGEIERVTIVYIS